MNLDFDKQGGLVPAIVQDADSLRVLMLGYMDAAAVAATRATGRVTFFSRSRGRAWTKGETSGHWLELVSLSADCDGDSILVLARPQGPTCHTGSASCFTHSAAHPLAALDALIRTREATRPPGSYTTRLFEEGVRRIAQKVGEEGVETALAAVAQDDAALLGESADLVFHLLVLLRVRGLGLKDMEAVLDARRVA
ncbi:Phosphoribosyl-AMP cyclohydrolase/ Phosphoribosyl-ATP pyrophosphatase [Lysobacter dokdonensis DS-58]|uniref:Histidine biosynthesis bifunctional protein HisIE n=1 Tax=Lysobacter dokdonensis DS-58 TaxID=1300345 RepID=A0A0A2WE35_9GAMM|nr:bifunctional phosphoribosyl-AMP cyclohydrolase/phosphoribosyl-ATP diphosphatase HisIE [Lysobacter dokdonensis]KGQ18471.1 Phosphoribosyl-AMP cyclohydrolase/ Phosphoribosyl-ATP pyrophosphatase [Lysobacter dokdonensis DS-58]